MFNLEAYCLSEPGSAERDVTVAIEQHSRIASLAGSVVHANAGDGLREHGHLPANTEPRICRPTGMEPPDRTEEREAMRHIMCHYKRSDPAATVADEQMTAH